MVLLDTALRYKKFPQILAKRSEEVQGEGYIIISR
jgi:hypothetical protein